MFKTLRNAWRITELKKKLLFTLLIIVLYRVGANIPVPFVDPGVFEQTQEIFGGNILQFLNVLSGEALGKATLLALGVSPYITASIVMQLLTIAIPALERLSKQGEEGKKKITAYTRVVTVILALVTSIGYAFFLNTNGLLLVEEGKDGPGFFRYAVIVACYCAGAALVMWLAEKINEKGIGNGISIILFANIIAGTYTVVSMLWATAFPAGVITTGQRVARIIAVASEIIIYTGMIMLIVWMSDAERRIPIQYAKRVVGRKMYGGQNTNLPLKVNMSGVMPIIFANSIVALPATIRQLFFPEANNWFTKALDVVFGYNTWPYLVIFLILLIAFAYFYVAISFNPVEVANNIKNNGGAIPGIRSGRPTVEFIKKVLNRITLVGALFVAFIACFPMLVTLVEDIVKGAMYGEQPYELWFQALAYGGSSLMIVVGVALETVRELEAQMSLRNYKGFLDN
ncbi:MAG: preprotein translocase subunit SecY [Clostridia bacterium]|nr:preprotein translocase subunit SecY [Clostridia bacterium]